MPRSRAAPCGQLGSEPTCTAQASCVGGAAKPRHFHPASRPMLAGRRLPLSGGAEEKASSRTATTGEGGRRLELSGVLLPQSSWRVCWAQAQEGAGTRHWALSYFVTIFLPLGHLAVQGAFRAVASKGKRDSCPGFPLWNQGLQRWKRFLEPRKSGRIGSGTLFAFAAIIGSFPLLEQFQLLADRVVSVTDRRHYYWSCRLIWARACVQCLNNSGQVSELGI